MTTLASVHRVPPVDDVRAESEIDLIYMVNSVKTDPQKRLAALIELVDQGKAQAVNKDALAFCIADLTKLLLAPRAN